MQFLCAQRGAGMLLNISARNFGDGLTEWLVTAQVSVLAKHSEGDAVPSSRDVRKKLAQFSAEFVGGHARHSEELEWEGNEENPNVIRL